MISYYTNKNITETEKKLIIDFFEKLLGSDMSYVDIAFSLLWKKYKEVSIDIKTRSSSIKEKIN